MIIKKKKYKEIQKSGPILCVDCLLVFDGKCLLLRRLNYPAKGKWWFPGGRIFKNELIKDAAERKIQDETGLHAKYKKILSIEETFFTRVKDKDFDIHTVNICCLLESKNITQVKINSDHDKYIWVDTNYAKNLNLDNAVLRPLLLALKRNRISVSC
jgi:colanic acid biosynthesis protein WcaH